MRPVRLAVAALLATVGTACHSGPTVTPGRQYSCCADPVPQVPYRTGETVMLHWTVRTIGTPSGPSQVELNAGLTGPHPDVAALKAASAAGNAAGEMTLTAAPVRPTGAADEVPTSVIQIPAAARPGYYNLVWSADEPGGSFGAASVVQVVAGS
ncbi:hypothetical protein GCM10022225_58490 [Plantactinospora mayteni]|uniref:Copper resistance protein CopC n=1 Tax=Plantactinospora mayteni TaxID=566021 RepID=A0ABQ4F2H2_9ACTN|nr:hypothetical protein [Plantactinospora mayteni]GIH01067.1 hypothetical protein Pma05_76390 [Plantactinospora mayteni]